MLPGLWNVRRVHPIFTAGKLSSRIPQCQLFPVNNSATSSVQVPRSSLPWIL